MRIVYHPGTGTIIAADECMVFDTDFFADEGFDSVEEVLANVDVTGIDLGALLTNVVAMNHVGRGKTLSNFIKK